MKTLHLFRADFRRSVLSFRLLFSVSGVPLLMLTAVWGMRRDAASVWYLIHLSTGGSGIDSMIKCILPVFAFGLSYAAEWEDRAVRCQVIRAGTRGYALSKILNCALSGFLTLFLGIGLFILILLPAYPAYAVIGGTMLPYEYMMGNGRIAGWLLYLAHQGLSGAMISVCALWFSTLMPNRFAAAAAPFLLYFGILRINGLSKLPAWLCPINWISGVYMAESWLETIGIKLITAFMFCAVLGILAKFHMDRRLLHE